MQTITFFAVLVLAAASIVAFSISIYQSRQESAAHATTPPADHSSARPLSYGPSSAFADYSFYIAVVQRSVEEKTSFIAVDLRDMSLTFYQEGNLVLEVPILAKGEEGSWREVPPGLYAVERRAQDYFSSFSGAHYPWSLGFQGNFFIHGPPRLPDGTPTTTARAGGIRLAEEDARALWEFTAVGTPVVVHDMHPEFARFEYRYKKPAVRATAFAAVDLHNGTVLAGERTNIQLPIASVTKLMTALVASEHLNMERAVVVPREALVETSVPRLVAGRSYSVRDLVTLALVESSNEAAEVLARTVGRETFVELMNRRSESIGMRRTSFIDPTGLGVGNSSTVEDLYTFVKYLFENRRFILNVTNGALQESGKSAFGGLQNFNRVTGVANKFFGGKVGQTVAARETYLGVFGLSAGGEERPIAVIVLGAPDAKRGVVELFTYLNDFYDLSESH